MKNIRITAVKRQVSRLIAKASFQLPQDIIEAVKACRQKETSPAAAKILDTILMNAETARQEELPLCQDCGNTYIDLELGPGVCIQDSGRLYEHLDGAVSAAYGKNHLRKSTVEDPLYERVNRGDNTPAICSARFVEEAGIGIKVSLKGGGSENCSYLSMQNPIIGQEEIADLVLGLVKENVTRCCPPVIIGIGIGSTASEVVGLARRAAFRKLDGRNPDSRYAGLERMILKRVNSTGIGPQGLGGDTTALACNIEFAPCHMATLPVSVFFQCHSLRRAYSHMEV